MNLDNNENNGLEQLKSFYNLIYNVNKNNIGILNKTNLNVYDMYSSLKPFISSLESSYCIINGNIKTLDDIYKLGYNNFKTYVKQNMPTKLYRYYSLKNEYGIQALKNNTVFLQTPKEFDDVFDSDCSFNYSEFLYLRLKKYCGFLGLDSHNISKEQLNSALSERLMKFYKSNGSFKIISQNITSYNNVDKDASLLIDFLLLSKILIDRGETIFVASKAIKQQYFNQINRIKTTFRASCFTTTPYSKLMWCDYANCHTGFCVEYIINPSDIKYNKIYDNLFPIIYCNTRSMIPNILLDYNYLDFTSKYLWDIYYCGTLRKSIDWVWQNEWRLLFPYYNLKDYNVEFYPITKVFLGNRMSTDNKKQIIDICDNRKIEYIGIKRTPSSFDLKECNIKCEVCPTFIDCLKNNL